MLLKPSEAFLYGVIFLNVFQNFVHHNIPSDMILDLREKVINFVDFEWQQPAFTQKCWSNCWMLVLMCVIGSSCPWESSNVFFSPLKCYKKVFDHNGQWAYSSKCLIFLFSSSGSLTKFFPFIQALRVSCRSAHCMLNVSVAVLLDCSILTRLKCMLGQKQIPCIWDWFWRSVYSNFFRAVWQSNDPEIGQGPSGSPRRCSQSLSTQT